MFTKKLIEKFGFSDVPRVQENIFLAKKQKVSPVAFVCKLPQIYTEKQKEKILGNIPQI